MQESPINWAFLAFSPARGKALVFGNGSAILCWFINASDSLAVTGRSNSATWGSPAAFCGKRGWAVRRLLHEIQQGTVLVRTIPAGIIEIDWWDPDTEKSVNFLAKGEVTIVRGVNASRWDRGDIRLAMGLDKVTVTIEVTEAPPAAATDAEAPSLPTASASAPAAAPAPLRAPLTGKELRDCILAIKKERPDDPPGRDELREEVETRLKWPVGRDRVDKLRKKVAPQWVNPRGRRRRSAQ
jgi:hypothetical protein